MDVGLVERADVAGAEAGRLRQRPPGEASGLGTPAPARLAGLPPVERRWPWLVPLAVPPLEAAGILLSAVAIVGDGTLPAALAVMGCHLLLAARPAARTSGGGTAAPPGDLVVAFACGLLASLVVGGLPTALPATAAWVAVALVVSVAIRQGAARIARRAPLLGPPRRRVAIVGNGRGAASVLDALDRAPGGAVDIVGYFDDRIGRPGPLTGRLPHLGPVDRLVTFVEDGELSDIYLALPWSAGGRIAEIADGLRFLPLTLRLVPDEALPAAVEDEEADRVVHPVLLRPPIPPAGMRAKAAFDAVGGLALLLAFLPAFLVVPVLIRLDSPGPALFRQTRIGRFGRRFAILKFRTLRAEAADAGAETLVTKGDRRVTRVGRVLRKYSLDELPQILNVLRGEMSLVGPRPHAPKAKADGRLYADIVPDYLRRYRVRPGLRGWAQVNGYRGETDTEETLRGRVAYDFAYIRRWSLLLDLRILLRTIPATLAPPAHNR